jgi:hypothetical protein
LRALSGHNDEILGILTSSRRDCTAPAARGDSSSISNAGRKERGAQWLRLGVVEGNARAERFWQRRGFVDARKRDGVQFGARTHTIRVMFKPLAGRSLREYLALIARDRPDAL